MWDYVRTGVICMRWYVPTGNVGMRFTRGCEKRREGEMERDGCPDFLLYLYRSDSNMD